MNWLQKRLDELEYTHLDLKRELEKRGITRVRATITGWTNTKAISLLNDPQQTKILADVLQWSVLEMLTEADYELGVPKELFAFIAEYDDASETRKAMFRKNLEFATEFLGYLSDEELDDPNENDGQDH